MTGFVTISDKDGGVFSRYDLSTLDDEELVGLGGDIDHDLKLMAKKQEREGGKTDEVTA